jgi:hypothetical protein
MELNGQLHVPAALLLRRNLPVIIGNHDSETSIEFLETVAN